MNPLDENILQITKDKYIQLLKDCNCTREYDEFMRLHKKGKNVDKQLVKMQNCVKSELLKRRKVIENEQIKISEQKIKEKYNI